MPPPLRQAKRLGKMAVARLRRRVVVAHENFQCRPRADTNDVNRLKPHQAVSTNTPPAVAGNFQSRSESTLTCRNRRPRIFTGPGVLLSARIPRRAPHSIPIPAPVCARRRTRPLALFNEPVAPPLFTPPAIPADWLCRAKNLRLEEIFPPTNPPPAQFGSEPLTNGLALPRENTRRELKIYQDFGAPKYSLRQIDYPTNSVAGAGPLAHRFRAVETLHQRRDRAALRNAEPMLWSPYRQSVLKGDVPVIGQDIFLDLTASSETVTEFRRVPTASGVSGAVPGEYEFYGQSDEISIQNNLAFSVNLFKGETAFRPVDWAIKLEPVFNVNYLETQETGVVSPDPRGSLGGGNNTPPPSNGFVQNPGDIGDLLNGQVGPADSYREHKSTDADARHFSRCSRRSWKFISPICRTITIFFAARRQPAVQLRIFADFFSTT